MEKVNRAEVFDRYFERFKHKIPGWDLYLTDSTYFLLMDWYDATNHLGSEKENSTEAHAFADYVWDKIHENVPRREMKVHESRYDGTYYYELTGMTGEELRSLYNIIQSAYLPERRVFNSVKEQIKKLLNV